MIKHGISEKGKISKIEKEDDVGNSACPSIIRHFITDV